LQTFLLQIMSIQTIVYIGVGMNFSILSPETVGRDVSGAARSRMRRTILGIAVILALLGSHPVRAASPPNIEQRFQLPILTVSAGNEGACRSCRFAFIRNAAEASPLSLAVSEDTPGGAGESVRASLWLAAMVAALDRMDPLAGTKVSLELSGAVDGPSAGAGVCLAILSALDGRDFPQDCAVTGAIMPDGTIGGVGGIAAKLRAAARAGVRRVLIPTYLRFEREPGGTEDIDLKRLAAELKLELLAVENVTQAYAALHGIPSSSQPPAERAALELPEATEDALKRRYQHHFQAGAELWKALPQNEKDELAGDAISKSLFIDDRVSAESAYRSGRLGLAASTAWAWHSALAARRAHVAYLEAIPSEELLPRDPTALDAKTKLRFAKLSAGFLTPETLLRAQPKVSEAGAQLWADYYDLAGVLGVNERIQEAIDQQLQEARKPGLKPEELETIRDDVFIRGQFQLIAAQIVAEMSRTWLEEQESLAVTLPLRPIGGHPEEVERLFHSSHLAVRNTFRHDAVGRFADELQLSAAQALAALKSTDPLLMILDPAVVAAEAVHVCALETKGEPARRYALAVSAHLQAEALANQSALVVRWNQLETTVDEQGSLIYGRTDLLNYLITTARENALRALGHCREKGLVPIGPIGQFESAEMARDDVATDKVEVLAGYWSASLQAKVLLMLCGATQNLPAVAPPVPAGTQHAQAAPAASIANRSGTPAQRTAAGSRGAAPLPQATRFANRPDGRPTSSGSPNRPPGLFRIGRLPGKPGTAADQDSWGWGWIILAMMIMSALGRWEGKKTVPEPAPPTKVISTSARGRTRVQRLSYACGAAVRKFFRLFS
jgi:hypothetical protein